MIVDTGANATIIPPEAALAIGCQFSPDKRAPIITAGNIIYLRVVVISQLTCLGENVRNLEVLCHELPGESSAQGVLGLDFLQHVPAFREFEQKVLGLTQP